MVKHILSVSGGKDSTALLLWAIERGIDFQPVFADTGNEHPITLDYVRDLPKQTGCPEITWVKADFSDDFSGRRKRLPQKWRRDGVPEERIQQALEALQPTGNPFLDLCILWGRFPTNFLKSCSRDLKINVITERVVEPLLANHFEVITMIGIRADESHARAKLLHIEDLEDDRWVYRPLLDWTVEEVFAIHRRHDVEPNPLYSLGCSRVGCMPCIHAKKHEIRNISKRFPGHINRIAEWEKIVSKTAKGGWATFFEPKKTPGEHRKINDPNLFPVPTISEVVRWSKTLHGGRQFDPSTLDDPVGCSSQYGLCE